jgi:hypothetical protein
VNVRKSTLGKFFGRSEEYRGSTASCDSAKIPLNPQLSSTISSMNSSTPQSLPIRSIPSTDFADSRRHVTVLEALMPSTINQFPSTINDRPLTELPSIRPGSDPATAWLPPDSQLTDAHHRRQASVVTVSKSSSPFFAKVRNSSSCPINTARRTTESSASPFPGTESGMISTSFRR